jgi:hypothetical protein
MGALFLCAAAACGEGQSAGEDGIGEPAEGDTAVEFAPLAPVPPDTPIQVMDTGLVGTSEPSEALRDTIP